MVSITLQHVLGSRGVPARRSTERLTRIAIRRLGRPILAAILLVLLLGLTAPFINANLWAGHIRLAVENSLGRTVTFSEVHFTLFSGPGFSLTDVSIQEDPRFGLEPFAFVPTLQARLRVGALLRGHLAFSRLRLIDPSLNIVKRSDGEWNVVQLVARLTAPSRLPLDLFPAFSVANARVDFKLGAEKTTLYVTGTDINVYPERSGKLYIKFSGSPARSDRAGNGFGHLHGAANWYLRPGTPASNQLEADVTLDPSDVSELTTLIGGQDAGVHGTVKSHAVIEGPATALRVSGDLHLADVHRWDLMPSAGEDWQIAYDGGIDLTAHTLFLRTAPAIPNSVQPVAMRLQVTNFMAHPAWTIMTSLNAAPASQLLPIGRRMGLSVPDDLKLNGAVDGVVTYSNMAGLSGGVQLQNVAATLPNLPVLHAATIMAQIDSDHVHFEPARIQTDAPGTMEVGGDYDSAAHGLFVTLRPLGFSVAALKSGAANWFGAPDAVGMLQSGTITGQMNFERWDGVEPSWSGELHFTNATLSPPGVGQSLVQAHGHVRFTKTTVDVDQVVGVIAGSDVTAAYHLNPAAQVPQRLHISFKTADLRDLETALEPTFQSPGLLARLGMGRRQIPSWMAARHLQCDLSIGSFSINRVSVGPLKARFNWNGSKIDVPSFQLKLPQGVASATGSLDVASNHPLYRLVGTVSGYSWQGGVLSAEGSLQTSGTGVDAVENLRAQGTFSAQDVSLSEDDEFDTAAGAFQLSFADGWPDLRLSGIEASDDDEVWTGTGASQSDGKLLLNLEHEGRQRRVLADLNPQPAPVSSLLLRPASK